MLLLFLRGSPKLGLYACGVGYRSPTSWQACGIQGGHYYNGVSDEKHKLLQEEVMLLLTSSINVGKWLKYWKHTSFADVVPLIIRSILVLLSRKFNLCPAAYCLNV